MSARSSFFVISAKVEVLVAPVPTLYFSRRLVSHFMVGFCGRLLAPSKQNGSALLPSSAEFSFSAPSCAYSWEASESKIALNPREIGTCVDPVYSGKSATCPLTRKYS